MWETYTLSQGPPRDRSKHGRDCGDRRDRMLEVTQSNSRGSVPTVPTVPTMFWTVPRRSLPKRICFWHSIFSFMVSKEVRCEKHIRFCRDRLGTVQNMVGTVGTVGTACWGLLQVTLEDRSLRSLQSLPCFERSLGGPYKNVYVSYTLSLASWFPKS